jgi:3-hydroxyacyl-[acyl-carrier-protein] dehydratase
MAAEPLIVPELWNAGNAVVDKERIREIIPQRFEMEHLDGVSYVDSDAGLAAGWKDVRDDEFWVRGHLPDRPLLPGVVMLEALAQLTSIAAKLVQPDMGFVGFGGIDACKFRVAVTPGQRLVLLARNLEMRRRRAIFDTQGWVDGKLAVEARITGVRV